MTTAKAVQIGLNFRRFTTEQIDAAYEVLSNTPQWDDRDVLAAKGCIEGFYYRSSK